ncbi:MAG: response regulator [Desulfosarcinaceae bacterium]
MANLNATEFDILLVEDNPGDRDLILAYLEETEKACRIESAGSLHEASQSLGEHHFNIALLDLGLPDSLGLNTLRQFKSLAPEIPTIVLTGLSDEKVGIEAIRTGAQDYLVKGHVNSNLLLRSLRYAIERHNLEGHYKELFNNMQQGVLYLNPDGRITQANNSALRILGISRDEILQRNLSDPRWRTIREDGADYPDAEHPAMLALCSGKIEKGLMGMFNPEENAYHWIKMHAVPEFKAQGEKPYGVFTTFEDVTELRKSEMGLRKSEEKYRSMMESFTDPLYICSPDFIVDYMNRAMILRNGGDATGQKCHYALHGLSSRCDWCVFDKVVSGENVETEVKSPLDGRNYRLSNMPIYNPDGSVSKMTIYRDVTDYLKAIAEKEKAQGQLVQAQKMEAIGSLAGGIAHDFNNILASVLGFTELALDEVPQGTLLEENLKEVYIAGKRARELVNQILAFARQSDEKISPVQPSKIADEVLKFIRSTIPTTIEIMQNIESRSIIMGNATQVHQLLMNLCTNAAQAMEDSGGILEVTMRDVVLDKAAASIMANIPQRDYLQIEVSDSGAGIPAEIIGSIFDPYFTTKGQGKGTGLGLAVVHGIVESYNGQITVDSTPGKGTVFKIYIPIAKKAKIQRPNNTEKLPHGEERILLVDDEPPIVKMCSQVLERLGYSVTARTSSIEALELFKTKPTEFDLVATDMTMPNMTGDLLAAELKFWTNKKIDLSVIRSDLGGGELIRGTAGHQPCCFW